MSCGTVDAAHLAVAPPSGWRELVRSVTAKWMRYAPHLWWGDRLDARFLIAKAARALDDCRVLDVGCNAGIILSETPDRSVRVGIDVSVDAITAARRLVPGARFVVADMLALPFRTSSFDAVILCGMLEVQPRERHADVLREAASVLRPEGRLYATTVNRRYPRYRGQPTMVTYEELEALVRPSFAAEIRGFNPLPPFPYFLPNRLLARVPGIWAFLTRLMRWNVGRAWSCAFLAVGVKR
jgi:SAM-dependent methyltransferase